MTFRFKLLFLFLGAFVLFSSCNSKSDSNNKKDRPNIIIIYADDLGYGELGSYGQTKIETPNIDRLAKEGMKFTQFYSGSPVCAPSRCILLTGMHSGHAFIRGNDEAGARGDVWDYHEMLRDPGLEGQAPMADSVVTIAEILQDQGYRTGLVGKWGLGYPGSEGTPNKQGFDYFYGYNCQRQAHTLTPVHLWENEKRAYLDNDTIAPHTALLKELNPQDRSSYLAYEQQPDYAPELMADKVLEFVSASDDPFFLYWATPIPHLPLQAPQKWVDYYVKKFGPEPPYLGDQGYFPSRYPKATYAAMISYLDENVGRLMARLKEKGIDENTIVIFTSDNGPTYTGGTDTPWFNSAGPFLCEKGWGKGYTHEGGIRVPMIARWPEKIAPNSVSDHIASMQDLFATIHDLIRIPQPESDGVSLVAEMTGEGSQLEHEYLYWEFPSYGGQRALRWGDYKAYNGDMLKGDTTIHIYNLKLDIQEQNDIAADHPDKVQYVKEVFKKEHVPSHNPRWQFAVLGEK